MNEVVAGEKEAANRNELRSLLKQEQIMMTQAAKKAGGIKLPKVNIARKKVGAKELAVFTRQFSVMIDAGLPLVQCLSILANQQVNVFFKEVLEKIREDVEEGSTLAEAFTKYPKVFDSLYTNMVEAGEAGGTLDLILQRLSILIEKVVKLKRSVVSALVYPSVVVLVAVAAVIILMIFIIPEFENIYLGLLGPNEVLPLPTRIVMGISSFIAGWGGLVILISVVGIVVGITLYYRTEKGRLRIDSILLKLPVLGITLRKIVVARFSRILSTLISSGVPILQSLQIAARTAGNVVVENAILEVKTSVERGENFAEPLKKTEVFPDMVCQMIGVGEQTGALDSMLGKIADFYEEEVDAAVADLLSLIEPAMIVILGVTIGGIVISMYLPLFTLIGKLAAA